MNFEIEKFKACKESIAFRENYSDFKSAWENCPRGDWMLWIAKKLEVDLLKLTTAKALCANTVRHLMKDERSKKAIDVAILFGQGLATREELDFAAADAYAAAHTATYSAAAYAANTDAYAAAYAADTATYSAAAYAAVAAYAADAYAADAAASRQKNQQETAEICRRVLTDVVLTAIDNL